MDATEIIRQLENELSDKKGIFSKKIDIDKCCALVDKLKQVLPDSLEEADYVAQNQQKILENADLVAKNTIRAAEERAEHIVDNCEIIKRAELDAQKIMEKTYAQCDLLVDRTKEHLDVMFKDIEQFLLSTLAMIRNNREELRGALLLKK